MQSASTPHPEPTVPETAENRDLAGSAAAVPQESVPEIGGRRDGPEPTRYGDWEKSGRCIDF